ncbi:MAG: YdcF family protein [Lachnospiraceae bacterium]|nr:YdcF family protein [Lachnospiraceae bacterium]
MMGFSILGGVCLLYYLVIAFYAGITSSLSWIWALLGGTLCLTGWAWRRQLFQTKPVPGALLMTGGILMALVLALLLFLLVRISGGMCTRAEEQLEYVVVLGAQVKGTAPSRSLRKRLDTAADYARKNPETILILSGGKGEDEQISEALCMQQYLTRECGLEEGRLVMEDRSTSTLENLVFSDELTGCKTARTGVLSNNYHVFRATAIARKLGYTRVSGIAAPSDPIMQVHYMVREAAALLNELRRGSVEWSEVFR